jgi:hypothetical protein
MKVREPPARDSPISQRQQTCSQAKTDQTTTGVQIAFPCLTNSALVSEPPPSPPPQPHANTRPPRRPRRPPPQRSLPHDLPSRRQPAASQQMAARATTATRATHRRSSLQISLFSRHSPAPYGAVTAQVPNPAPPLRSSHSPVPSRSPPRHP